MALVASTLSDLLQSTFRGVDSFAAAAAGWASAYRTYAQSAQANGVPPVLTGLEEAVLAGQLTAAFAALDPNTFPSAFEAAFQAFWLTPPVAFGSGAATLAPPGLGSLLVSTYPANLVAPTSAAAAINVAAAIDAWTRLVSVTFPGPVVAVLV